MFRFLVAVALCVLPCLVPALGFAQTTAAAAPCTINTIQDLQKMSLSGNYCLAKDIDATGMPAIPPIGGDNNPFVGQFDGRGHAIVGLKITNGTGIYVGLFAFLDAGGTISNIGLANLSVSAVGYDVGGLVGRNKGTITNSYTTGSVNGTAGNNVGGPQGLAIGGVVGWNFGTITQSYSAASVTSPTTSRVSLGGLSGGSTGTIRLSYAAGNITGHGGASGSALVEIGGLVGELGNSTGAGTIENSYATGTVTSTGSNTAAGGLVGAMSNSSAITKTYAAGPVTGSPTHSGGLVGYSGISPPTVSTSYWDTYRTGQQFASNGQTPATITPVTSAPGQASAPNYAFKQSAYSGFDFTNVWAQVNQINNGYPFFRLFCPLRIECNLIYLHEGLRFTAYLPTFGSGVTISQGVDLGPTTVISSKALLVALGNNVNDPIFKALDSVLTQPGKTALKTLSKTPYACSPANPPCVFQNLTIVLMSARALFDDAAYSKLYSTNSTDHGLAVKWPTDTKTVYYPQFSDLPAEAQTVLFDLHYVGLFTYSDPFWHDMTATEWQLAVSDLKKLANADTSGYKSRILDDANLLQQLASRCPARTSCQ